MPSTCKLSRLNALLFIIPTSYEKFSAKFPLRVKLFTDMNRPFLPVAINITMTKHYCISQFTLQYKTTNSKMKLQNYTNYYHTKK